MEAYLHMYISSIVVLQRWVHQTRIRYMYIWSIIYVKTKCVCIYNIYYYCMYYMLPIQLCLGQAEPKGLYITCSTRVLGFDPEK